MIRLTNLAGNWETHKEATYVTRHSNMIFLLKSFKRYNLFGGKISENDVKTKSLSPRESKLLENYLHARICHCESYSQSIVGNLVCLNEMIPCLHNETMKLGIAMLLRVEF